MEVPELHMAELKLIRDKCLPQVSGDEQWHHTTVSDGTEYSIEFVQNEFGTNSKGHASYVYLTNYDESNLEAIYDCDIIN